MDRFRTIVLLASLLYIPATVSAQDVIRYEGMGDLDTRFDWAIEKAANVQSTSGFWIAYSFTRIMCENCYSGTLHRTDWDSMPTLTELITGKKIDEDFRTVREAAERSLDQLDGEGPMVPKAVAVLFKFERNGKSPSDLEMSTMSLTFDLGSRPMLWLGQASNDESIVLLRSVYESNAASDVVSDAASDARKGALWAIGMHDAPNLVIPFLSTVLSSDAYSDFRKAAAYGLGNQDDERALRMLRAAALSNRDAEVSKAATYAIGNSKLESANSMLEDILDNAPGLEVRKAALYSIGNHGTADGIRILVKTALDPASVDLAQAAVYALVNTLDNNDIEPLVKVLQESTSVDVRKAAVYALGNIDSDEARRVLTALIEDLSL